MFHNMAGKLAGLSTGQSVLEVAAMFWGPS